MDLLLFFKLLIGHALCDYPLQGDFIAKFKSHKVESPIPGVTVWWHLLTAHALIHAGFVWWASGSATLGLVELALHWGIDWMKSQGWTNLHGDQALHVLCRIIYACAADVLP